MDISKIPVGKDAPWNVNVIIEVPMGSQPIKYEMDKDSGALYVDRFLHTAMFYPCNYGFIPHTLSGDGDPADVLIVSQYPVQAGSVMAVRPIGVLLMEDDGGVDEKILAVPQAKLHPFYNDITSYEQLPAILIDQIRHFFEHYKDLEKGKWVKILGWKDQNTAAEIIMEAIERYKQVG